MGVLSMLLPAISPYLNKVPDTLEEIDKKYGVNDSMWLLRRRPTEDGGVTGSLEFMHTEEIDRPDGTKGYRMSSVKDLTTGEPVRYNLEQLLSLLTGENLEEEES